MIGDEEAVERKLLNAPPALAQGREVGVLQDEDAEPKLG
jgi:hypothetical protein